MGKEVLNKTNMSTYSKDQLKPCNSCDLKPVTCDKTYAVSVPGTDSNVMCVRFGVVEIIDLSKFDTVKKVLIPRTNGQSEANNSLPAVAEAVF